MRTYLLLGSNIGDSRQYLEKASQLLGEKVGEIVSVSSYYQTAAWGNNDQPDFLNQVLLVETTLSPAELLRTILETESELGRKRLQKWGSRTIDIDILFYGNEIVNEPSLIIPHPFLHKRRFTLMPLNEIAPQFVHPVKKQKIEDLLKTLDDNLYVKKLS